MAQLPVLQSETHGPLLSIVMSSQSTGEREHRPRIIFLHVTVSILLEQLLLSTSIGLICPVVNLSLQYQLLDTVWAHTLPEQLARERLVVQYSRLYHLTQQVHYLPLLTQLIEFISPMLYMLKILLLTLVT